MKYVGRGPFAAAGCGEGSEGDGTVAYVRDAATVARVIVRRSGTCIRRIGATEAIMCCWKLVVKMAAEWGTSRSGIRDRRAKNKNRQLLLCKPATSRPTCRHIIAAIIISSVAGRCWQCHYVSKWGIGDPCFLSLKCSHGSQEKSAFNIMVQCKPHGASGTGRVRRV